MNRARLVIRILVNASAHFVAAKRDDHPLDLPPVAKTDDIASVAALLGAARRLQPRIVSEALDQLGRVGKRRPSGDEGRVHSSVLGAAPFLDCRQSSSTMR